jgi:hypothetical protein
MLYIIYYILHVHGSDWTILEYEYESHALKTGLTPFCKSLCISLFFILCLPGVVLSTQAVICFYFFPLIDFLPLCYVRIKKHVPRNDKKNIYCHRQLQTGSC